MPRVEAQDTLPGDRWKDEHARKAQELETARKAMAKLEHALSASVSQNAELQRRYETLYRELEGARLFLNTADTFADTEVIQTLAKLNTELQHTSTLMAERVVDVFTLDAATLNSEQQTMAERASESVGATLMQFLWTAMHDESELPLYLQIAFQAYLVHHIYWIVSSWTLDQARNTFINEIYRRLREAGKTPTFKGENR